MAFKRCPIFSARSPGTLGGVHGQGLEEKRQYLHRETCTYSGLGLDFGLEIYRVRLSHMPKVCSLLILGYGGSVVKGSG